MIDELILAAKVATACLALAGFIAAAWAFPRKIRPKWRRGKEVVGAVADTFLGSPAIVDRGSGVQLRDAQPALGVRLHAVEQGQKDVTSALETIADLIRDQKDQDHRIEAVEHRVAALEHASIERTVTRAESAAVWTAIAAERAGEPPADPSSLPTD